LCFVHPGRFIKSVDPDSLVSATVFFLGYVCTLTMATYYLLKIQGKAKIPDYVQLRDEQFTLLAYFRLDRPEKSLVKVGLAASEEKIMSFLSEIPFGKVHKLEI
jgi:hypothetical protein